jgi:hypothetical protein
LAARRRGDRPLSTPRAAGGGGQRPAFIGVYRPPESARRDWCMVALGTLPPLVNIRWSGQRVRRIGADSRRGQHFSACGVMPHS